jgi:hypothetical protein
MYVFAQGIVTVLGAIHKIVNKDGGETWTLTTLKDTHQDRREGRQPRPLCRLPEVAIPRILFADILRLVSEVRPPLAVAST